MEIMARNRDILKTIFSSIATCLKMATGPPSLFKSGWKIKFFRAERIRSPESAAVVNPPTNMDRKSDLTRLNPDNITSLIFFWRYSDLFFATIFRNGHIKVGAVLSLVSASTAWVKSCQFLTSCEPTLVIWAVSATPTLAKAPSGMT